MQKLHAYREDGDSLRCQYGCRSAFKTYVKTIVNRRNTITGVLYRDDPTIMAWDLANEPYVLGDASGEILRVHNPYHVSLELGREMCSCNTFPIQRSWSDKLCLLVLISGTSYPLIESFLHGYTH